MEQCDAGNDNAEGAYGEGKCTTACENAPYCGDGVVDSRWGVQNQPHCYCEACDPPNGRDCGEHCTWTVGSHCGLCVSCESGICDKGVCNWPNAHSCDIADDFVGGICHGGVCYSRNQCGNGIPDEGTGNSHEGCDAPGVGECTDTCKLVGGAICETGDDCASRSCHDCGSAGAAGMGPCVRTCAD